MRNDTHESSVAPWLAMMACAATAGVLAGAGLLAWQRRRTKPDGESFADAVVLISGGSRGFGLALAR